MSKTEEAVKYMISVWDEVSGNWRDRPDHVQQKFIEAEKEMKEVSNGRKEGRKESKSGTAFNGMRGQPGDDR